MTILKQTKWLLTLGFLGACLTQPITAAEVAVAEDAKAKTADNGPVDLFDAIDQGLVDAKFVARNAERGKLVLTNKTKKPVDVLLPEAFAGVPVLRQFGGGGGGLGGGGGGFGGGGGGGNQSVGGGGGGGAGGGGRGGGGGGRGFNIAPEQVGRINVQLLCLDHGLKDPSSNKPYEVRPIEDVVDSPALIEIVKGFANGDLPRGASQAAAWHINSKVSWQELAAKQTGTVRSLVRHPYFNRNELQAAMEIVGKAEAMTAGQEIYPRNWQSPSDKAKAEQKDGTPTPSKAEPSEAERYEGKQRKAAETEVAAEEASEETPSS